MLKMTLLKTNADHEFPWEASLYKNGVLVIFDYFKERPTTSHVFAMAEDPDLLLA